MYIRIKLNHFAVHQKLTQHCKSTIPQLKICLGLVHWDDPEGWYGEGVGRGGSGWGVHVHPWQIHVDVWQSQYNIVQ